MYWITVAEYAKAIYEWADRTAKLNTAEPIVDLSNSSDNRDEIFYQVPIDTVKQACELLQKEGKALVSHVALS